MRLGCFVLGLIMAFGLVKVLGGWWMGENGRGRPRWYKAIWRFGGLHDTDSSCQFTHIPSLAKNQSFYFTYMFTLSACFLLFLHFFCLF